MVERPDDRSDHRTGRQKVELSVVLPTLNGAKTIGEQLAALLHQTTSRPYEVIVVDNGSTDDLSDVVTAFQAGPVPVSLITAVPPGLNRARNAGVKFADGENILLCDCDDIVGLVWMGLPRLWLTVVVS